MLGVSFGDLQTEVARFLGYSVTSSNWDALQSEAVAKFIRDGYRRFLYPIVMDPGRGAHQWSFLKPTRSIQTVGGRNVYDLPPDFGSMEGDAMFSEDSNYSGRIPIVPESKIRDARQSASATGYPQMAALIVKETRGLVPSAWCVHFWPDPDGVYNVRYRAIIDPLELSVENPWPVCGPEHADTLIESCLAAAEIGKDDAAGVHSENFMRRLQASIEQDGSRRRSEYFGNMNDPIGDQSGNWRGRSSGLTVKGAPLSSY